MAGFVGHDQLLQEQPPEQAREHAHWQESRAGTPPQRLPSSEMPPPGTIMWPCG
jgi:hypothetical protein